MNYREYFVTKIASISSLGLYLDLFFYIKVD